MRDLPWKNIEKPGNGKRNMKDDDTIDPVIKNSEQLTNLFSQFVPVYQSVQVFNNISMLCLLE